VIYRGQIVATFDELQGVSKFDIGVLMTGGNLCEGGSNSGN